MKTSLTLAGIGPRLALVCLPYIALALSVMLVHPGFLDLGFLDTPGARMFGAAWLAVGVVFWAASAVHFLANFGKGKLITGGPFALCRNPIYASVILFVIPSLGVYFHSGLVLSISVVLYIGFKVAIHGETVPLRKAFGRDYDRYAASVNEMVPFPRIFSGGRANP